MATPNPYGAPPPYASAPDHPSATTVLVLGILGLVLCQILSPVAWVMGNRVVREIDSSQGRQGGRSAANAGRICGIVGSILLIVAAVLVVMLIAGAAMTVSTAP